MAEQKTDLIPPDPGLQDLQSKYFGEAITNLLTRETPEEQIFTRPGRGRQTFRYVPIAWFINQLNALFGFNWDFEVTEHEILEKMKQIWVKGRLTVRGPGGVVVVKTQFGGSDVKYNQQGAVIDIADDLKSASSDCLKKCASLIGMAWDVYSGSREALTETGPSTVQLVTFYRRGEQAGMDKDALDEWFTKQTGINKRGIKPEEAVVAEIMGAIPLLIKLAKEKE